MGRGGKLGVKLSARLRGLSLCRCGALTGFGELRFQHQACVAPGLFGLGETVEYLGQSRIEFSARFIGSLLGPCNETGGLG